jgi:hypothetical protein
MYGTPYWMIDNVSSFWTSIDSKYEHSFEAYDDHLPSRLILKMHAVELALPNSHGLTVFND